MLVKGRSRASQLQPLAALFRSLHAHGLIARIRHRRRRRVTNNGRDVMGTSIYLREHHFPDVYSGFVH
jgi:hypothetical protein